MGTVNRLPTETGKNSASLWKNVESCFLLRRLCVRVSNEARFNHYRPHHMALLRSFAKIFLTCLAGGASAETKGYGSFLHNSDLPRVLFLTGTIEENDSFELRRAMRDQVIDLVIPASPGGNLYEGLQIAAILHDNDIGTYVPSDASCESSCANIFLGGASRLVVGELGVHQFYSGAQGAGSAAPQDVTTAVAQYTTSDIIGIMNQFDTPPFVYEKMFGTTDIYYFTASEKPRLNRGVEEQVFSDRISEVDAFLEIAPQMLVRQNNPDFNTHVAAAPNKGAPVLPEPPQSMEKDAFTLLASINADWSLPNDQALPRIASYYAQSIDFYGSKLSRSAVLLEKQTFAERWPIRDYRIDPNSISIKCSRQGCVVESVIVWSAASLERAAQASGMSTWLLVLVLNEGTLQIANETGKTLKRD